MVPEMSRTVRRVAFLLVVLSAMATEIAAIDTRPVAASLGMAAVGIVVAILAGWLLRVPTDARSHPPKWVFLILFGLAIAPFGIEPLRRDLTGDGYAFELQMVFGLRNVGLWLAVCSGWFLCLRLASVVSLFLILFAAAMSDHTAVMVILGLYTIVGSFWLVLAYWTGLKAVFVAPERAVTIETLTERHRFPWAGLILLILAIACGVALAVIGPKRAAYALGELMPTSGGTGDTDPFARYGVGDGPEETAGDNAKTAGMVETDKMIEDNKNSLIDAVNDMFGAPHKPPKDQERMVAAGKVDIIEFHGKLPDNRRPSRDFDTARNGQKKGNPKPESRKARGLFEVEGRTPLHVRLVAYERYDAAAKRWIESTKPVNKLLETEGDDWMRIGHFKEKTDWYWNDERHKLKAADLKENLVPTPTLLTRFRINKVDKPDYYEWDYEGVLALAGRKKTPPGVVITTECRTLDAVRLPEAAFARTGTTGGMPPILGDIPASIRPQIEQLARAWTGDLPRGWPQIDAILTKLRSEYALDRTVTPPVNHPAPVLWFLNESHAGPDYLFATAAAMMLRSLDYSSRMCMGYYAAPDAYDAETAHTPVKNTDLHMWAEVRLHDGHWLVVEATPGYAVLGPNLPFSQRVWNALAALGRWASRHVTALTIAAIVLTFVWLRRREWMDAIAVRVWVWFPGRTWREQIRRTIRVLERRGRWAGRPRPPRQTVLAWVRNSVAGEDANLAQLTRMTEWAAYSPDVSPPWPETDVTNVCRRVLGEWTHAKWRNAKTQSLVPGAES